MDKRDEAAMPAATPHPPAGAPGFFCPSCECPLHYEGSHASDRSGRLSDLTDHYICPAGCGTYEYERHTHRLRLLDAGYAAGASGN
ncbi:MAG: hypothetical protein LAO77_09970 [Acidobacteriia bacterium]|nr:hypothetical protein [Terriglobia bacterium]